jgi:hypothetical protein
MSITSFSRFADRRFASRGKEGAIQAYSKQRSSQQSINCHGGIIHVAPNTYSAASAPTSERDALLEISETSCADVQ